MSIESFFIFQGARCTYIHTHTHTHTHIHSLPIYTYLFMQHANLLEENLMNCYGDHGMH